MTLLCPASPIHHWLRLLVAALLLWAGAVGCASSRGSDPSDSLSTTGRVVVPIRPNRAGQISEAAEALVSGVKAAANGEEEPPDVGRSLSQLFAL